MTQRNRCEKLCVPRKYFSVFCKCYDPKLGDVMVIFEEDLERADIFVPMALVRNFILAMSEHRPIAYLG